MKKSLSVLLSFVMLLCVISPCAYATEAATAYPTVIVAGYSASNLYLETENGPQKVWGVDLNEILSQVLHNIARIGKGLGQLAFGHPEYISDVIGKAMVDMYGILAYTPNGTSVNEIHPYSHEAANTQFSYLYNMLNGENVHEADIMKIVANIYGDNGNDMIFGFQTDFRQNIIDIAADLDRYIDSVRAYTGKDKVNILAVSHGGEVSAVYLSLYGVEKQAVNNAVLTVPAIGGAALAYDVMSESVALDEETLLYFIEYGNRLEEDYDWLVRANRLGFLDAVCNLLVHNYVKQILGYWGSMWDFIPAPYYDELKQQYLDEHESSELIRKSDVYHYELLPHMTQSLNDCLGAGINIYLIAGADHPSVTGLQENSDAIITVNSSTGAYTAPYGQRFANGYQQQRTVCADLSHNHLSPAMTIDASCGYLPETTWYVNGLFHGMTLHDPYAISLLCKLLFADVPQTVHTDPAYPQFHFAQNRSCSVTGVFDVSANGYVSGADSALIVRNLSDKYKMKLVAVACQGADLSFNIPAFTYIPPGEAVSVPISGTLPETSLSTLDLTISYLQLGSITPLGEKTYTYTVLNGEAPVYDAEHPLVPATYPTPMENTVSPTAASLIRKSGYFDWFTMIFNMMYAMLRIFTSIC